MIILDLFPLHSYQYELPYSSDVIPTLSAQQRDNIRCAIGIPLFESLVYVLNPPFDFGVISINQLEPCQYRFAIGGNECQTFSTLPKFFHRVDHPDQGRPVIAVRHGNIIYFKTILWKLRIVDVGHQQVHAYYESQNVRLPVLLRISTTGTVRLPLGSLYYMPPDEYMERIGSRGEELLQLFQHWI
jgi:hypothetical protein